MNPDRERQRHEAESYPETIPCPGRGCDLRLPADDLAAQRVHMMFHHPNIVRERLEDAARWDGWEDEG